MRCCSLCRSATTWQLPWYELAARLALSREPSSHPLGAPDGEESDEEAGEVVDDVVPAEIHGRDDGESEHRPQAVPHSAVGSGAMRDQCRSDEHAGVKRGEGGD